MNIIFLLLFIIVLSGTILFIKREGLAVIPIIMLPFIMCIIGSVSPMGNSEFEKTRHFTLTKTPSSLILSLPDKSDIIITNIRDYNNADKVTQIQIEKVCNAWGACIREDYKLIY